MDQSQGSQFDLRTAISTIRRRWVLIGAIVGIGTLVAVVLSSQQEELYRSSAEVLLGSADEDDELGEIGRENALRIIESDLVADQVEEMLGYDASITVEVQGDSDVILLTATSLRPDETAAVANAYADVYLEQRRDRSLAQIEERRKELQARYDSVTQQLEGLTAPLAALDAQIAAAADEDEAEVLEEQRDRLMNDISAQRQSLIGLQATYAQEINNLLTQRATLGQSLGEVLSRAEPPSEPFSPAPLRDGVAAALVCSVLAIGLAFTLERLDDTIGTVEDLQAIDELPVLGTVPDVEVRTGLVTADGARDHPRLAEAFRLVRTGVNFVGVTRDLRTMMVTSASLGDGKTTVAMNLAAVAAWEGKDVCLIEADLRRPTLAERLGVAKHPGLTELLIGKVGLYDSIMTDVGPRTFAVLPAGQMPPNPAELLGSAAMEKVLADVSQLFDLVIVDSPPVLPVTDALVLAPEVDAVLMVAASGISKVKDFDRALDLLRRSGTDVIGTVLNMGEAPLGYYRPGDRATPAVEP